MDRSLDDSISERMGRSSRGGPRGRGSNLRGRNGYRKWNSRPDTTDIDADWVHDKYEDDPHTRVPRNESRRNGRNDRHSPERGSAPNKDARIRVDNLHYDLTEDDLEDLFTRIAPISSLSLRFDRAGRSTGTAYVSYASVSAADRAVREFNGANAAGQPIRLTLLPTGPSSESRRDGAAISTRNPFDTAIKPGRSLFDRVEDPDDRRRTGRSRSRSPAPRRSNVVKPAPEGVDRYVPGDRTYSRRRRSRSRSPPRRRRSPVRRGRGGSRRDEGGHVMVGGRPRKTQEELDREMEDYWGSKDEDGVATTNGQRDIEAASAAAVPTDEDVDMIT